MTPRHHRLMACAMAAALGCGRDAGRTDSAYEDTAHMDTLVMPDQERTSTSGLAAHDSARTSGTRKAPLVLQPPESTRRDTVLMPTDTQGLTAAEILRRRPPEKRVPPPPIRP